MKLGDSSIESVETELDLGDEINWKNSEFEIKLHYGDYWIILRKNEILCYAPKPENSLCVDLTTGKSKQLPSHVHLFLRLEMQKSRRRIRNVKMERQKCSTHLSTRQRTQHSISITRYNSLRNVMTLYTDQLLFKLGL